MKSFIVFFLLLSCSNLYPQETKLVIKDGELIGFTEEYYVLKANKKIKHGTYVKYRLPLFGQFVIIESGNYSNGRKDGMWEFFYDFFNRNMVNSIKEKGNYIEGKKNGLWTSYYLDTVTNVMQIKEFSQNRKIDSINLNVDQKNEIIKQSGVYLNDRRVGEWISFDNKRNLSQKYNFSTSTLLFDYSIKDSLQYNKNRKPLFIGGLPRLTDFVNDNFNLTKLSKVNRDSTFAIVSFTINELGNTENITISESNSNKTLQKELIGLIALTDDYWLPGLRDSIKVKCSYRIRFDIIEVKLQQSKGWKNCVTILN